MNPAEFQNIAKAEDEMWWFAGMRKILESWIGRLPDTKLGRVLEGGCGTGYMSQWLAERYGWEMYPVDLDFGGLSFGRSSGVPRMVQTNISRLPYADGVFDAVVSLDVLVHFPRGEEAAAIEEFCRVLKPGGKLVLRVSALDALRSRHSIFAHERQRFTKSRIVKALGEAGFEVRDVSYANSLLLPVAWFKFRIWEEWTRQEPQSGVGVPAGWLNSLLYIPLKFEAFWLKRGKSFGLGQSILVLATKPN